MNRLQLTRLGADPDAPFPPTREALLRPNGLLAWGGGLEPQRLLAAYRLGIFPWYSQGEPILWWSPAPRCVIFPAAVHLSQRTRRRFNTGVYRLSADTAFSGVIAACAEPRKGDPGTWITPELRLAFEALHQGGSAHSVEVWRGPELVGGIYGLALGRVFFGESMFSRATDASKIALTALCRHLVARNFGLLDCQVPNPHLKSLGAVSLSRLQFENLLRLLAKPPFHPGRWTDDFEAGQRW
jgi:leucyl/phenylalanyl-tRNA---protein transferase